MNNIATEKNNLNKQVIIFRILAGVIPIALLVVAGIFSRFSTDKIIVHKNTLQEISTKTQAFDEATSFNGFITTNKIDLEKMNMAIPSESMLVGVIQDIEAIIRQYDEFATVKFSSATPAKIGQDLIIPMNVYINLPLTSLGELYQKFSGLPYILQVISSESQLSNGLATTIITLRLYVQEPFAGY
jgi:hypothetical protein